MIDNRIEKKCIITSADFILQPNGLMGLTFINMTLHAGKAQVFIFQMTQSDKFRIKIALDSIPQDHAAMAWFSSEQMGPFFDHQISLSKNSPDSIQLIQNPNDVFLSCDQFGSLINMPAGQIFFNIHNLANQDIQYTMTIVQSPCV